MADYKSDYYYVIGSRFRPDVFWSGTEYPGDPGLAYCVSIAMKEDGYDSWDRPIERRVTSVGVADKKYSDCILTLVREL